MLELRCEILTLDGVTSYLKAGKRTAHRLTAENKLTAFNFGGTWSFRRVYLDKWISSRIDKAMVDDDEREE